jgi:vitamin B12 transporter
MLALFFFVSQLYAQDIIIPIQVEESGGPMLEHTSSPVWRALPEDLASSSQLQDTLNKAPGVMFTQSGGVGAVGSFYLRGSESRHIVVLTDGLRNNDPSSTGRNFDSAFLYTSFFQELLLQRGPAPVLYGGDATGGVLELVPRRGADTPLSQFSLSAGSFATLQGHALQDWKAGDHRGTFGIAHLRTDGFSRLNRKRHGASEADGAETTQLMQASEHRWSELLKTNLFVMGLTGMAEQDSLNNGGVDSIEDRTLNRQLSVVQTTSFKNGWLKVGILSQKRENITAGDDETYRGETRVTQLGHLMKGKRTELVTGLEAQQEWQGSPGVQKQNDLGALFVLGRLNIDRWKFEVGGRGEHHQRYGNFFASESTLKHSWEMLAVHAKVARGYKTPSLYQLYGPDTFGPLGNRELEPETNLSHEVGFEWQNAGLIGFVFFQQDFKNLIDYSTTEGYVNRNTLRVKGAEADVVSPEHSWGQVSLTWTQLDFSYYTKPPLRRPPYLGQVGWFAALGDWSYELNLRLVGGRRDTDNIRMTAYEVLSGAIKWRQDTHQEWTLKLGNITDRLYEDVAGYSVAPLNVSLGWSGRY